jgi:signal recognition particle subunit SEC65
MYDKMDAYTKSLAQYSLVRKSMRQILKRLDFSNHFHQSQYYPRKHRKRRTFRLISNARYLKDLLCVNITEVCFPCEVDTSK